MGNGHGGPLLPPSLPQPVKSYDHGKRVQQVERQREKSAGEEVGHLWTFVQVECPLSQE